MKAKTVNVPRGTNETENTFEFLRSLNRALHKAYICELENEYTNTTKLAEISKTQEFINNQIKQLLTTNI